MNHHLAGLIDRQVGVRQKGKKNADEVLDRGHVGLLVAGCFPLKDPPGASGGRSATKANQEPPPIRWLEAQ